MCLLLKVEVEATPSPKKGNGVLKKLLNLEIHQDPYERHRGSDSDR